MEHRNAFLWSGTRASILALIVGMTALGCARGGESRSDTRSGTGLTGTSRGRSSDQAYARGSSGDDYTRSGTASGGSRYGSTSGSQGYEQERAETAPHHRHHRHATRTATAEHAGGHAATAAGPSATDRQLTTRVKQVLSKDTQLKSTDVDVEARHGTVTLHGRVDQDRQRRKAEQLARKVKGVKKVENRIQVGSASNTQEQR